MPILFSISFLTNAGCWGTQPAECANGALSSSKHSQSTTISEIVHFCSTSESTHGTGACFGAVLDPKVDRSFLCHKASNISLALCANQLRMPSSYSSSIIYEACSETEDKSSVQNIAECLNAVSSGRVPLSLLPQQALRLCSNASNATILCASDPFLSDTPADLVVKLCQGSSGYSPVNCFRRAPFDLSLQQKAMLCSGAISSAPVECVKAIPSMWRHRISLDEVVQLCKGAKTSGPALCIGLLSPAILSIGMAVRICTGADDAGAARCFKDSESTLLNQTLQELLCAEKGKDSKTTLACLSETPYMLPAETKVRVCQDATTNTPGLCSAIVWNTIDCLVSGSGPPSVCRNEASNIVLNLCRQVGNTGPALCLREASKLPISWQQRAQLCQNAHKNKSRLVTSEEMLSFSEIGCARAGLIRRINSEVVVKLCKTSSGRGPVQCVTAAPEKMRSSQDLISLCKDAQDTGPSACAEYIISKGIVLPSHHLATLCHGVSSNANAVPGTCFSLVRHLEEEDAVMLCTGSVTLTPAHCALSLRRSMMRTEIGFCRNVESRPMKLHADSLQHDGAALYPGSNITVQLSVIDQFGQRRTWDNETVVKAWMATASPATRPIEKRHRMILAWNESISGLVSFYGLQIAQAGNFTMHFSLNNTVIAPMASQLHHKSAYTEDALVRLRVAEKKNLAYNSSETIIPAEL